MRGKEEGDRPRLFRRWRKKNPRARRAIKATTPTPAPIPAFAPVDKPLLLNEDVDAGLEDVEFAMVVDVPSAAGKATEENPGLLIMGVCSLKEKRWPL